MSKRGTILILDDDIRLFRTFQKFLKSHNLEYAAKPKEASGKLRTHGENIDLIIIDLQLNLPEEDDADFKGLEYIQKVKKRFPHIPVMVVSQYSDVKRVLRAGQYGADAYWWKDATDFTDSELWKEIDELIIRKKKKDKKLKNTKHKVWGRSQVMQNLFEQLITMAKRKSSFLLSGEAGTQIESLVHFTHNHTDQIMKEPVKAELTLWEEREVMQVLNGDHSDQKENNFLKKAKKSTLHIPDIEQLSQKVQKALLSVWRTKNYLKRNDADRLNIQFVFSSHIPIDKLKSENLLVSEFFTELHYLEIPSLRTRKEDVKNIILDWLDEQGYPTSHLNHQQIGHFCAYQYPNNTKELLKLLEITFENHKNRYSGMIDEKTYKHEKMLVEWESLPKELSNKAYGRKLEEMDKETARNELCYIEEALQRTYGDKGKAADLLGKKSDAIRGKVNKHKKQFPGLFQHFPQIEKLYFSKKNKD